MPREAGHLESAAVHLGSPPCPAVTWGTGSPACNPGASLPPAQVSVLPKRQKVEKLIWRAPGHLPGKVTSNWVATAGPVARPSRTGGSQGEGPSQGSTPPEMACSGHTFPLSLYCPQE